MFSNIEAFAMLFVMRAVDDARTRDHADAVVVEMELDERLAAFIPLRPGRGKRRQAYDRLLSALGDISKTPEPERTRVIQQLHELVDEKRR